jgi:Bacterial regulatory protein, Fis family
MSDKRGSKGLTAEQVIDALRDTNGNMSLAARKLKVTRAAIAYYVREYPTVRAAHDEAAAYVSDIAEGHLVNGVIKGDWDKVRYWLETKGKERGYGRSSSVEIAGPGGGPIPIAVDRRAALAAIAPRSVSDSDAPGDDQGDHDG